MILSSVLRSSTTPGANMSFLSQLAFYPTLYWNVFLNRVMGDGWPWFSPIDEIVILGALPFKTMIQNLVEEFHVGGVVCLNEPHELDHEWVATDKDWDASGVAYCWIPTPDFVHAPPLSEVDKAVNFIKAFEGTGSTVYIHCKAGRTRSATVAACYLIQKHGWTPDATVQYLQDKRRQVVLRTAHWETVRRFAQHIADKHNTTTNSEMTGSSSFSGPSP